MLAILFAVVPVCGQKKRGKVKAEPFVVVQVDQEVRIVKKSGVKTLKNELAQEYKRALASYASAKKQAKKDKVKFKEPKPKKKKLKTLKGNFKTEESAQAYVDDLAKKAAKKRAGKKGG